jgi:hypothetical protein
MLSKVLQQHVILFQVRFHPLGINDSPQRAAEYQAIKPRQNSPNPIAKFRDKLFHGVSLRIAVDLGRLTMIRRSGNALGFQSPIGNRQSAIIASFGCGHRAALCALW